MGNRIRRYVVYAVFFSSALNAQKPMRADSVDMITYQMAISGRWEEMMSLARKSIRSGTDFHYLRLRMGIYYYNKGNYRRATHHLIKAYNMYKFDDLNNEYLYYACYFANRNHEGYYIGSNCSMELKNKIKFKKRYFDYLYSNCSYSTNNNRDEAYKLKNEELVLNGYQTLNKTLLNVSIGGGHRISSRTSMHWAYYGIQKQDYLYSAYTGVYNFYDNYNVDQDHFYLSMNEFCGNGWNLTLSGNFVHTTIYKILPSNHYFRKIGENIPDTVLNAFSASAGISKDISMFNLLLTSNFSNFSGGVQFTQTAALTYYPFGNFNLYISYIPSYHVRIDKISTKNFISSSLLGFKIFRHLWNELYFSYGEMQNFSSYYSYYIYNDINPIYFIASTNFIIPLKQSKIFLRYSLMQHRSFFQTFMFDNLNNYNRIDYTTSNITGGLIWYF